MELNGLKMETMECKGVYKCVKKKGYEIWRQYVVNEMWMR